MAQTNIVGEKVMKWFIAGIMQGSIKTEHLHGQDYRGELSSMILRYFPDHVVFDPFEKHQDSIAYDDQTGKQVFMQHNRIASESDVLVAFVPEATMGTAIEMWEAWKNGVPVIAISEMCHSWAIKFTSHLLFNDLEQFESALKQGVIAEFLDNHQHEKHY